MTSKTYKREMAFLIFVWNVALSIWYLEALKVAVIPSFAFIGLAYGLDWHGKNNGGK